MKKYRKKTLKSKIKIFLIILAFLFGIFNIFNYKIRGISDGNNQNIEVGDENSNNTHEIELNFGNRFLDITINEYEELQFSLYGFACLGAFTFIEFGILLKKSSSKAYKSDEKKGEDIYEDAESTYTQEHIVFELVQEYLERNRYFDKEKIFPYISSRIAKNNCNLNNNGIRDTLNSLEKKNLVVEGSKLTKENLLFNSNRRAIYNFVIDNPGVYSNKIANNLKLSVFSVDWHLNMLLKFNIIKKERIDNRNVYFDSNFKSESTELIHLISRDKCRKILEFIELYNEGCTKYKLSKELGMHPTTITKYILKIEDFGLLFKKKLPNKTLYFLNEEYYNELNEIIWNNGDIKGRN